MLRLVVGLVFVSTALSAGFGNGWNVADIIGQNVAVISAARDTATKPAVTLATADTSTVADETTTETASANTTAASIDYATLAYVEYLETHPTPCVMSLSNGAPIKNRDAYNSLNRNFLHNENLMEGISHIVSETIPGKVNHEKGAGAGGYFEVTHDITNICKTKLFNEIGKQTPVRMRFSNSFSSADTVRDTRGFGVKFYTEDGNFDIPGFNFPIFFFNDPTKFTSIIHIGKNNPKTGSPDPNSILDYALLNEELLLITTMFFTDSGTPGSYGNMPGYSVHGYQVSNANNDIHFVRFHFIPYNETRLTDAEAITITGRTMNFLTKDLYNRIEAGNYPEWTVGIQVLTLDDVLNDPRLVDVSRYLPEDRFPIQPVGKIVLNKNPDNYFAEMGQIQFLPSSLVPGIQAPPDKLFQARIYAYRLSGNHRLGVNFNKIPVNAPLTTPTTYTKDGPPPVLANEGNAPTYFPNSFNGPEPIADNEPETVSIKELPAYNRDQVNEFYNNLSEDEKTNMIQNFAAMAVESVEFVRDGLVALITEINEDYGNRLGAEIARIIATSE